MNCSPLASEWGIRPGIPLAEARGLCGGTAGLLVTEPAVPIVDRKALSGLATICQTYSPMVGLEEDIAPDSLLLDITGCAPHFGGEEGLSRQLWNELAADSYHARIAVAETVGAAWALSHFATTNANPIVVSPVGQQECLRNLPIDALRLSERILETLRKLGLKTIGQVERLPRSTLPSRFGVELQQRLDQAWGIAHELIIPIHPPQPISAIWNTETLITGRETLELVAKELLGQILGELCPMRHGIRELQCDFKGAADSFQLTLRLVLPSVDEQHLCKLISLEWERQERSFQQGKSAPHCLVDGITSVRLEVTDSALLRVRQQTLFEMEPGQREQQAFRQLIERISSRLGTATVLRSQIMPDPQPELACEFSDWSDVANTTTTLFASASDEDLPAARSRPLRLLPVPEPIEVMAVQPDGPPHVIWLKTGQRRAFPMDGGPERIATGWWREQDIQRDYYRVEVEGGQHYWIFRCLQTGRWFLHGLYD